MAVGSALLGGMGAAAGAQQLAPAAAGSIGGTVYHDVNRDGVQAADEPGLAGVQMQLRTPDGVFLAVTTTSYNGAYSFAGLDPGTYMVVEDANPDGYSEDTTPNALVMDVNDAVSGVDFGDAQPFDGAGDPGAIVTRVFLDANRDGVLDSAESGRVPGATVRVIDGGGNVLDAFTTGVDGVARWAGAGAAMDLWVEVHLPGGYEATTPSSSFVHVEPGQVQTVAVGAAQPAAAPTTPAPAPTGPATTTTTPGTTTSVPGATAPSRSPSTLPLPDPGVPAPITPAAVSPGRVALPAAPPRLPATGGDDGTDVLGARASQLSAAGTGSRALAATGRDIRSTAGDGFALLAGGGALVAAAGLVRRRQRSGLDTGTGQASAIPRSRTA